MTQRLLTERKINHKRYFLINMLTLEFRDNYDLHNFL